MPDAFTDDPLKILPLLAFAMKPEAAAALADAIADALAEIDRLRAERDALRARVREWERFSRGRSATADVREWAIRGGPMPETMSPPPLGGEAEKTDALTLAQAEAAGPASGEGDAAFPPGTLVVKNPSGWGPQRFNLPGRGEGIGEVVEPPDGEPTPEGVAVVRWPAGWCRERIEGLKRAIEAAGPAPTADPPYRVHCPQCLGPTTPRSGGHWCDICRAIVAIEAPGEGAPPAEPTDDLADEYPPRPACPLCGGPTEDRGGGVWCAGMCGKLGSCCDGGAMEPGGRVEP